MVRAVDQRDVDLRTSQAARRGQPAKAAAHDDDLRPYRTQFSHLCAQSKECKVRLYAGFCSRPSRAA